MKRLTIAMFVSACIIVLLVAFWNARRAALAAEARINLLCIRLAEDAELAELTSNLEGLARRMETHLLSTSTLDICTGSGMLVDANAQHAAARCYANTKQDECYVALARSAAAAYRRGR